MVSRMIRRNALALAAVLLANLSCKSTSEPPPAPVPTPTTITVTPTSLLLSAIGAASSLNAVVEDENGNTISAVVTWSSTNDAVATVDGSGIVRAITPGSAQVTGRSGTVVSNAVTVTVAPQVDSVLVASGGGQMALVGTQLPLAIVVTTIDEIGNPVSGVVTEFAPAVGSGTVTETQGTTDAAGQTSTMWTLGQTAGVQSLGVTASGRSLTISATALADVADSIFAIAGNNQMGPISTLLTDSLKVQLVDQFGNAVDGGIVTFAVTAGGGTVDPPAPKADANGIAATAWTLGAVAGTHTVEASMAGLKGSPVVFNATPILPGTPALIEIVGGDGQDLLAGAEAIVNPTVVVKDANGIPVPGESVIFAVTAGAGSIMGSPAVTDANGVATSGAWTYDVAAGTNSVSASVAGVMTSVVFSGEGVVAGFDVDITMLDSVAAGIAAAFTSAETMLESIIVGDLPAFDFSASPVAAAACGGVPHPSFAGIIDDVKIWVQIDSIDGAGGVLGSAGPCLLRPAPDGRPLMGAMRFDVADMTTMMNNGTIGMVVLHEMSHVLGIGTLWDNFGFLQNPSLPSSSGVDTHFDGPTAIAAFDKLGGTSYTGGAKVPVENTQGGQGTQDGHWRETTFGSELMTGFIGGGANPLSLLTVGAFADMDLAVDPGAAEAYNQVFTVIGVGSGDLVELEGDILQTPIYSVGPDGTLTRIR